MRAVSFAATTTPLPTACIPPQNSPPRFAALFYIPKLTPAARSTIIHLLMRHYDPTAGRVLLDGLDLRALNVKCRHHRPSPHIYIYIYIIIDR